MSPRDLGGMARAMAHVLSWRLEAEVRAQMQLEEIANSEARRAAVNRLEELKAGSAMIRGDVVFHNSNGES